jgi:predicted DNA-binding protein (UPF0251 family)
MPRPCKCRNIGFTPEFTFFKPAGIRACDLEAITLTFDELEAMRLTALEGLYQELAAERMGVSRQTLGNILTSAHRKVTDCLVNGKAIRIEGGRCRKIESETVRCRACGREWQARDVRSTECPHCAGGDSDTPTNKTDPTGEPSRRGRCKRREP